MDTSPKRKAIEASAFVLFGFGLSQVIRLAGNIALTRLLAPELFGLLNIARVFVVGIWLFSDIGLGPAIVRSERADEPVFLNTVWTLQVIRGGVISALCVIIAYPVSLVYKEPKLFLVVIAIGALEIPSAFLSTALPLLNKRLQQRRLTQMELAIQCASLACMIATAYFYRSVWALLLGELLGNVIRLVWSHRINAECPNRFALEREAAKEVISFGKWILLSTAMNFLATQADRMLLGKLFTLGWFGVYSVAINLAELPKQVVSRLSSSVLFPLISSYARFPREELREKIRKPRGKILPLVALGLALFSCFGDIAIRILYDQRYDAAAWMLPILAIGMWPLVLVATVDGCLLSLGKPKFIAYGNLAKFLYMLVAIPLSFKLWSYKGAIAAVALNDIPSYVIINYGLKKERLSFMKQDAWSSLVLAAATAALLGARYALGLEFPGDPLHLFGR